VHGGTVRSAMGTPQVMVENSEAEASFKIDGFEPWRSIGYNIRHCIF
jgi:hypothetical protein